MKRISWLFLLISCTDAEKDPADSGAAEDTAQEHSTTFDDTGDVQDGDGDGFALPDDCDDADAAVHPGAEDLPENGVDEDCDGVDSCVVDAWYPSYVSVHNDAELAAVADLCTSYDGIQGDVSVTGVVSTTDLSPFSCMCGIGGRVRITTNPGLSSLGGLEKLTELVDELYVDDNPALFDLSALGRVASVQSIVFDRLPLLESLGALRSVTSWNGPVYLSFLPLVPNLAGLEGMTSISELDIVTFESLASLNGLENLVAADLLFISSSNGAGSLTTLEGLDSLDSVELLKVWSDDDIQSLGGLPSLRRAGLSFSGDDALATLDLPSTLTELVTLHAEDNASLASISGFMTASTCEGDLALIANPLLVDLVGLSSLSTLDGDLIIQGNDSLTSLAGLLNLTAIGGDVTITDNASLQAEEVEAFLDAVGRSDIGGTITVSGNGS